MGQKSRPVKEPAEQVVKQIRRVTRRQFSAEEKIRIVLSGLRGEDSIAELCRREGIVQNLYYRAGRRRSALRHRPPSGSAAPLPLRNAENRRRRSSAAARPAPFSLRSSGPRSARGEASQLHLSQPSR